MPGSWLHLGQRFFASIRSEPLDDDELGFVADTLTPSELGLFTEQPVGDQRHGLESARYVSDAGGSGDLVRAAALHDIGKRHASLGVMGRVLASIVIKLRLPAGRRVSIYRDHGPLGAIELEALGAPSHVVTYVRHHHGRRPATFEANEWRLLTRADEVDVMSLSVRGQR